jgi:hypothetical protein
MLPIRRIFYCTSLIRDLVPHELGGIVDLVFASDALVCRIEIPLRQWKARLPEKPVLSITLFRFRHKLANRTSSLVASCKRAAALSDVAAVAGRCMAVYSVHVSLP